MIAVARAELLKLTKRVGIGVIILVWPVLGFVFGYLIPYLIRNLEGIPEGAGPTTDILLPQEFIANAISGFPLFGFALGVLLGALAVGSEFGWGTLGLGLIQRPTRTSVYLGRLVALVVLAGVMTLLVFVMAAVVSPIMAGLLSEAIDWPVVSEVLRGFAGGWLIMTVAVLLGATLALMLRSTALAVGLGLVYVLVLESLFAGFAPQAGWIKSIARFLPGVNAGGLAATLQEPESLADGNVLTDSIVSGTQATVVLFVYLVVLTLIGLAIFRRRDVAN